MEPVSPEPVDNTDLVTSTNSEATHTLKKEKLENVW